MENKKNILIIDDMKPIRDILWFSLKQEGYRPVLAESGRKGLDILYDEDQNIDLVILDIMMPKMDGYQVLEKIRMIESVSDTPVIMLTAKSQKRDVIKGLKKGADDYIIKPYKFEDLVIKIKNLIG